MIRPLAAARAVAPLAAAAEEAHRHGLVLGCDHPQRIRITPDGRAQLSFVLPRPDVTPADDVRGLGAILYTLLTSRWPLSRTDAARAGLAAAERTSRGGFVAPSRLRPGVPVELDTLVQGTLGPPTSSATCAPRPRCACCSPRWWPRTTGSRCSRRRTTACRPAPATCGRTATGRPPPPDPQRRRNLAIGLSRARRGHAARARLPRHPAHLGVLRRGPAGHRRGRVGPAGAGRSGRPGGRRTERSARATARRSAARPSPPASRSTTAAATGTTTGGCPG